MTFVTEFPVRFGDIDHAHVVYYPRFFHFFHRAFEDWFGAALGASYAELVNGENIGFPSVKVDAEFIAPLRYGDRARIELELVDVGKKSITCRYTLTRMPDGVVSARATIKTVAIRNDTFASLTIPEHWRERFQRFMDEK